MDFADDLDAIAALGWGPERLDELASTGLEPGALATFHSLEPETRSLVLRILGAFGPPTERDHAELAAHPAGRSLARWMLSLPPYAEVTDDADAN